jgi:hypothetical protein
MARKRGSATVPPVESATAVEQATDRERLAADLRHLNDLLERERIEEARRYVTELQQRWPDAERVQHYAHVLAPPVARSRPDLPNVSHDRAWQWLQEHGHEYPGCWLAILDDHLIAADPDRRVVLAKTREILGHQRVLMFHQPGRSESP